MTQHKLLQHIGYEEIPRHESMNGFSESLVFFPPQKAIDAIASKHLLPTRPQALITRWWKITESGEQLSRLEYEPPIFYRAVMLDTSKRCFQTLREHDNRTPIDDIEWSGFDYDLSTGKVYALRDEITDYILDTLQ